MKMAHRQVQLLRLILNGRDGIQPPPLGRNDAANVFIIAGGGLPQPLGVIAGRGQHRQQIPHLPLVFRPTIQDSQQPLVVGQLVQGERGRALHRAQTAELQQRRQR